MAIPRTYATAGAFRRALEERLKSMSQTEQIDINRLRRQVSFDRLLARLFQEDPAPWVLKGGYALEAQYAVLLGHKMRWKVTYNAREAFHLHEIRTSPQAHPSARKLLQQMHEKLAEVHPLLAEAMKFVNQGEDPALSRLAAERYTQYKLSQLDK